ncbi:MAG: sulfite exporter TauE/SafE family protein [Desulfatitalea sp.]|nr:sulfite exporter TauE/SafE family protein [Desulfatitalea sp.]
MISDPVFYVAAIPCVLLYGMAKGGLGPAVGAIVVPIMSLVISPVQAAAILLPILCVIDIFTIRRFWGKFDKHHLKILLPAGIVGIVIASVLMGTLPPNVIRMMIGVIVILFCLNYWSGGLLGNKKGGRLSGWLWGTIAGFTSTQIHAGGPPISIYLLPQNLDKIILMGTMAIFFAVVNYLKLIPYTLLGALDLSNLLTSLLLMPLAPVGVKLGYLILYKVSQKAIYRFLYIALFLSGMKLVYDGLF